MKTSLRLAAWTVALVATGALAAACSEDGAAVGKNRCPDLPLYKWVHDDTDDTWARLKYDESGDLVPLDADEEDALNEAEKHCITPLGTEIAFEPPPPSAKDAGGD